MNNDDEEDVVIVENDLKKLPFRDVVKVTKALKMRPTKGNKEILIQKIIKFNNKKINERLKNRQQSPKHQHNYQRQPIPPQHHNKQQTIDQPQNVPMATRTSSKSSNSHISLQHISVNSSIYTMGIKDITHGELVFWKVFKNKYILHQITSYLCVNQFSTKYNELVDLVEMVENGQIELVKYKLSKGHHLDFAFNQINQLYSRVGNDYKFYNLLFDKYSKVIYASLEQQAIDSIIQGNDIVLELLIERFSYVPTENLMEVSIRNCNYKALIHLLEYDHTLFNNDKHWSILLDISKFTKVYKIINVLVDQFNKVPSIILINLLNDSLFKKCPYESNFKLSNLVQACTTISILNELKNPISSTIKTQTNNEIDSNDFDFNFDLDQEDYFEFNTIVPDQESIETNSKYQEYKNSKQKPIVQSNHLTNLFSRDTIESFQFTDKELGYNIDRFNKLNFNVKKLMKMYLSVVPGLISRNCRYLLSFKSKFNWKHFEFKNIHGIPDHDIQSSHQYAFKYGNFAFLEQYFKSTNNRHYHSIEYFWYEMFRNYFADLNEKEIKPHLPVAFHYPRFRFTIKPTSELPLFQYIKNDKLKQVRFLKDLIAASKDQKRGTLRPSASFIFRLMVFSGDLDLVKYTFEQFKNNTPALGQIEFKNFGLIRSIEMLDWVYDKFKNTVSQNFNHWFTRCDIKLFVRHIQLLEDDPCDIPVALTEPNIQNTFKYLGFSEYNSTFFNESPCNYGKYMKMIRFIVENPNYFTYNSSIYEECYFALNGGNGGNSLARYNQIQDLQFIIENTSFNYKRFISIDCNPTTKDGLFINWVLKERQDDIKPTITTTTTTNDDDDGDVTVTSGSTTQRCEFTEFNIVHANYLVNRWDLLLEKEDFVTGYKKIWVQIIDMNQVDLVLNIFTKFFPNQQTIKNSSPSLKPVLLDFLYEVVDRNRCEILIAIFNHFPYVFQLQTNGHHNSLFGVDKIRRLLYNSISKENVDIASFFLDTTIQSSSNSNTRYPIISLTETQFKERIYKYGRNSNSCICKLFQNRFMDNHMGGSDISDEDGSSDEESDSD